MEELKEILVELIDVNPHQPRRHFMMAELEGLAASIREMGLIHPPLVRPRDDNRYELVSGERRFRAAQMAGMTTIPVIVRVSSDSISAQQALVENIQRVDLNPLEIALALRDLIDEFGYSQEELSHKIGKNRSTVSNYLRLLGLPRQIQDSIGSGVVSMGHAKAILAMEGFEKQIWLFEMIVRDDLTVREAEQAAQRLNEKAKKKPLVYANRDFYLEQLEEKIEHRLGTKVNIQAKGKRGRISIDYYNLDDLDRLLALIGIENEL